MVGLLEQLRVVWHFHFVTGNDQTLLWYAARDWGQLRPRAPHFYGQRYGNTLEAIPVEILRRAGVAPNIGLPLTLCLLALGTWLMLAWVAWRLGHPTVAVAAAAAPIVLSTYSSVWIALYGGIGRVLGVGGLTLLLVWPKRLLAASAGLTLWGFAVAFDLRSALFVVPMLVYLLLVPERRGRLVRAAGIAAVPLAGWLLFVQFFYRTHPDYVIYPQAGLQPAVSTLGRSLSHPDLYWQMFTPELMRWWLIPVVVTLVLLGLLLATRQLRFILPALVMSAIYLVALAARANLDPSYTFLPAARLVHFAPIAIWVLALLVAESHTLSRVSIRAFRPIRLWAAIVVVAMLTAVVRVQTLNGRFAAIERQAGYENRAYGFAYVLNSIGAINSDCRAVGSLARRESASLAVYLADDVAAYACGAIHYGRIVTLFPFFERRTWLLRSENRRQRDRMLLQGVSADFCTQVAAITTRCTIRRLPRRAQALGVQLIAAVRFPPQTSIHFLDSAHIVVRPFGPHCAPTARTFPQPNRPEQCHRQPTP
jgi:hypothetical protein